MLIRVYYEDTDAGGIVYHTNYIKYCERARSELFFEKGLTPTEGDGFFVVRNINANFLGTAILGDMLSVTTKLVKKKNSSLTLKQSIFKEEKLVFDMELVLVFVREGRPSRIPESMMEILE